MHAPERTCRHELERRLQASRWRGAASGPFFRAVVLACCACLPASAQSAPTDAAPAVATRADSVAPELPDAAMQAVVIVSSRHVRRAGDKLAVPVERYLVGRGPDELYVTDRSSDPPVVGITEGEAWILFLFTSPRGLDVLVALQDTVVAVAPDGSRSHALPPRSPESLADLVVALRACRHGDGAAVQACARSLLESPDADLRLVGLQLAGFGLRQAPVAWDDAVQSGAAHALGALSDAQPLVRHAAIDLLPVLPPLVALRRLDVLLAVESRADVRAELAAAAIALCAAQPGAHGADVPASRADKQAAAGSEVAARDGAAGDGGCAGDGGEGDGGGEGEAAAADPASDAVSAARAQLAATWPALRERDAARVRDVLAAPDSELHELGARWVAALVAEGEALPSLSAEEATERLAAWLATPAPLSDR